MSEDTKVEAATEAAADENVAEATPKKKGKKKWPIIVGVVAVVVIAAGAGFWVWHEQPSFCNAFCHTPMDPYLPTYEAEPGQAATDKWGNEVENASSMLAAVHRVSKDQGGADATCMSCHVPDIGEQVTEGINWVTGNYVNPLEERDLEQLVEARGIEEEAFCMNEACHVNDDGSVMTREDLVDRTSDMGKINPHLQQHGAIPCSDCHKAHRASVMYCTQCHSEAEVPEGWLTVAESNKLSA